MYRLRCLVGGLGFLVAPLRFPSMGNNISLTTDDTPLPPATNTADTEQAGDRETPQLVGGSRPRVQQAEPPLAFIRNLLSMVQNSQNTNDEVDMNTGANHAAAGANLGRALGLITAHFAREQANSINQESAQSNITRVESPQSAPVDGVVNEESHVSTANRQSTQNSSRLPAILETPIDVVLPTTAMDVDASDRQERARQWGTRSGAPPIGSSGPPPRQRMTIFHDLGGIAPSNPAVFNGTETVASPATAEQSIGESLGLIIAHFTREQANRINQESAAQHITFETEPNRRLPEQEGQDDDPGLTRLIQELRSRRLPTQESSQLPNAQERLQTDISSTPVMDAAAHTLQGRRVLRTRNSSGITGASPVRRSAHQSANSQSVEAAGALEQDALLPMNEGLLNRIGLEAADPGQVPVRRSILIPRSRLPQNSDRTADSHGGPRSIVMPDFPSLLAAPTTDGTADTVAGPNQQRTHRFVIYIIERRPRAADGSTGDQPIPTNADMPANHGITAQQILAALNSQQPAVPSNSEQTDTNDGMDYELLSALDEIFGPVVPVNADQRDIDDQLPILSFSDDPAKRQDQTTCPGTMSAESSSSFEPLCLDDLMGESSTKCHICYSEYDNGDKMRLLHCRHGFHQDCLDTWLVSSRNTCPLCRAPCTTRTERERTPAENESRLPRAGLTSNFADGVFIIFNRSPT